MGLPAAICKWQHIMVNVHRFVNIQHLRNDYIVDNVFRKYWECVLHHEYTIFLNQMFVEMF